MPLAAPECPDCRVAMSEGFVPDNTYGKKLQSRWVAGAPEESFWSGIKVRGDVPSADCSSHMRCRTERRMAHKRNSKLQLTANSHE
jgi:hypothetical protein